MVVDPQVASQHDQIQQGMVEGEVVDLPHLLLDDQMREGEVHGGHQQGLSQHDLHSMADGDRPGEL